MSIVKDRRVVVTGKVEGYSRTTAQARLREAGAIVQDAVGKDTDVLVTGSAVGAKKIEKATALGIDIVPWEQAFGEGLNPASTTTAPRAPMPTVKQWAPMLCGDGDGKLPAGDGWIFEMKWDGIRGIATIKDGGVAIQSRSGKTDLTDRFPQIVAELSGFRNCVLDGELVGGQYMVFDILQVDETPTANERLESRRAFLDEVVTDGTYVGISPVFEDGEALLQHVTEQGLEGLVAKQKNSRYIEGSKGREWLKVKVRCEQEFLVLGYTLGEGSRRNTFGALILGYYGDDGEIVYAGKVGTGWDARDQEEILAALHPHLHGDASIYKGVNIPAKLVREAVFHHPEVIVQIAFQKWTDDLILWHPSYVRLRDDKPASEVTRDA